MPVAAAAAGAAGGAGAGAGAGALSAPFAPAAAGAYLFSGGLGGLGLLTARLLVERGAARLVLTSRSGKVQPGSEADWEWRASELQEHARVDQKLLPRL